MKNEKNFLERERRHKELSPPPSWGCLFKCGIRNLCRKIQNKKSVFGSHNLSVNQPRFFQILENPTG